MLYATAIGAAAMAFSISPRIYTPLVVIVALLWLVQFKDIGISYQIPLLRRTFLTFAAMYAVQIIGLAYTKEWAEALKELETKSSLPVLSAMILFSGLSLPSIHMILRMFVVSILIISVYLLFYSAVGAIEAGHGLMEFVSGYQYQTTYFTAPLGLHPTYLSLFASFSIFFLADNLPTNRKWLRIISIVAILFLVYINFVLLSRGALIGFGLGTMTFMVHKYAVVKRKTMPVVVVAVVLIIMIIAAFALMPNFRYRFVDQIGNLEQYWSGYHPNNSTSLHIYSWKCSISLIMEKPLFGYGTGDEVERLLGCYAQNGLQTSLENRYNAHNEFFSTMIRHGILGVAVLGFFFIFAFKQAARYKDSLLLACLVLFVTVSMFESTLNVYRGVVFLAMFEPLLTRRCAIRAGLTQ